MQNVLEHTKIVGRLQKNKLDLKLIKKYNIDNLLNCCKKLEETNIDKSVYAENQTIQQEIILDNHLIDYLLQIEKKDIDIERIEKLAFGFLKEGQKVSKYEFEKILQVLENENISKDSFYDYLEYFSERVRFKHQQNIIANNLIYFYNQTEVTMNDLTEAERELFFEPMMSDRNLIPIYNIKKVCQFLVEDKELKNIILFLFKNNLSVALSIEEYELIHENSKEIYGLIKEISTIVDDNQNMYGLLLRWLDNGCMLYDLRVIEKQMNGLNKEKIGKVVYNLSSYINFIYGSKLKEFPLEYVNGVREKLLVYAISHNKNSFLQLIQKNAEEFLSIGQNSILFNESFYSKYINLNTLIIKNLQDLKTMNNCDYSIKLLANGQYYTFEEIKLLMYLSDEYINLYNELLDLKIDQRMLIIKQLAKRELLNKSISIDEIHNLAQMLKIKHLYNWIEKDFAHIKGITPITAIKILVNYQKIEKYILQFENETEALYVIRNIDNIQQYESLNEIKDNIENIDGYWQDLIHKMNFDSGFIEENKGHIRDFLLKNGAELALKYCKSRYGIDLESFKKVVKAELMGQFEKLKYFNNDLQKEIEFNLTDSQIEEWKSNSINIYDNEIDVRLYDDFYSTMILGEYPQHTCLSYNNGAYNHCLMACFDSNKKILYAKINDKIVARAMVRLTKGTYSDKTKNEKKLAFVDLENIKPEKNINEKNEQNEYLTIFLEKTYISGVSSKQEKQIKNMFISLLKKKAMLMNTLLVLSNEYSDVSDNEYIMTRYHMYISKSKAGAQYLDSLNGENRVTDEGQYKANTFLIWQKIR